MAAIVHVIVYDRGAELGAIYYPPQARIAQLVVGFAMSLADALAAIAVENLPGATNLVFTTLDQLPTLNQAKNTRVATIRAACAAQITGGYSSSALGSAYAYPSTMIDQANMIASVTNSLFPGLPGGWTTPFWCADGEGAWSMLDHTAAQIQQAGSDGKAFIVGLQRRLVTVTAAIVAATTTAEVDAIVW